MDLDELAGRVKGGSILDGPDLFWVFGKNTTATRD
jgi:hypothetical protein